MIVLYEAIPVSYTHLDVYKRQVLAKRVQHLLLRQTIQLALRLKPVARQLQKTLVRPRMRLLRRKLLSLQNWWELG